MSAAHEIMYGFNSNALIGSDGTIAVMIEDVSDPDGRIYRMEYQSTEDGRCATACCLYNPWGGRNGGVSLIEGHVTSDGFLCLGRSGVASSASSSPYDLATAIERGRYWCTAFSVLKETGRFPQP